MKYRPDIDGLRAVAVISVLLFHAGIALPRGYVGVDVFFVISGYLITGLLLKALEAGTFTLTGFWQRRVRRLVPALALVTLVTGLASSVLLLPEHILDLGGALIAQPLLLVNVYFWRVNKGGYFGDPPEIRPMLHTWSLGVEEQFYLFYPLLLIFLFKKKIPTKPSLAVIGLFSFALCVACTPVKSVFSFYNLPTRAWELILGALIVFIGSDQWSKTVRSGCSGLGLGLIILSVLNYGPYGVFPGWVAAIPCLGSALILATGGVPNKKTPVEKFLSNPLMVMVGQMSYSLYLWHWPLMAFAVYYGFMSNLESQVFVLLISGIAGYASWKWVETPFRQKRLLPGNYGSLKIYLSYIFLCFALGIPYILSGGLRGAWSPYSNSLKVTQEDRKYDFEVNLDEDSPRLNNLGDTESHTTPKFLLVGDSHAISLAAAFDALGKSHGIAGLQLTTTFPKVRDDLIRGSASKWFPLIEKTLQGSGIKTVYFAFYWESYTKQESAFFDQLRLLVERLSKSGIKVVLIADVPRFTCNPSRFTRLALRWPLPKPQIPSRTVHENRNKQARSYLEKMSKLPHTVLVDPAPMIFEWSGADPGGKMAYYDGDHLTDHGAELLEPLFEPFFANH